MKRAFVLLAALAAFAALLPDPAAAQSRSAPKLSGKLLLTGSSTMAPLIADIAKRFEARHPEVKIEVQSGGSGRGINDARAGKADIGMASRALNATENDLRGFPIARDGVAVIVHQTNAVRALSDNQLRAIFTGKVANWKAVGGPDRAIVFIGRGPGRSSNEVVSHYFKLSEADFKPHKIAGENLELLAASAAETAGIAWLSVGDAEKAALAGAPIRLLPVEGIEPSARNISTGDYPIARPLNLVTGKAPAGLARAFIDFALSPAVANLVRQHDFIPYQD